MQNEISLVFSPTFTWPRTSRAVSDKLKGFAGSVVSGEIREACSVSSLLAEYDAREVSRHPVETDALATRGD
jgi:hypothetical protein